MQTSTGSTVYVSYSPPQVDHLKQFRAENRLILSLEHTNRTASPNGHRERYKAQVEAVTGREHITFEFVVRILLT